MRISPPAITRTFTVIPKPSITGFERLFWLISRNMASNLASNGEAAAHEEDDDLVAEEEEGFTIKEYVEGLEAQELEVDMVLGGDDGKECTYPKGYLPRQAVFSCITCCPDGNAGVCTACSLKCHDGHEVIEIWTRRHFRCDCGNSKFGILACKLYSGKDSENDQNVYNKNYKGVYCTCSRPYPDPDSDEDKGEMLQCCICEDWFHEAHLGLASLEEVPRDEEGEPSFDEVICQACAASLDFLSHYRSLVVPTTSGSSLGKEDLPAEDLPVGGMASREGNTKKRVEVSQPSRAEENSSQNAEKVFVSEKAEINEGQPQEADLMESKDCKPSNGAVHSNGSVKNEADCSNSCQSCKLLSGFVQDNSNGNKADGQNKLPGEWTDKALFLTKNWRSQLCRCDACLKLYADKGVSFLMRSDDTITKYEEVAKLKRKEKMDASGDQDLSFLNGMSHVKKIEFLHGLNEMTTELSAFLNSQESGKTVTSADIYEFFENLKKKRTRLE